MKIVINKDSLGTALKACQKLVPRTIAFPATEYAVLERTHSVTSLYYSNLNQSVRMLIDFPAGDNFKYLIPVNNVSEYLKTLPDGEITITFKEIEEESGLYNITIQLPLRSKKLFTTKCGIDDYPRYIKSPKSQIKIPFMKFSQILNYCRGFEYTISEGGVSWMNGILMIIEDKKLTVFATNRSTHMVMATMHIRSEMKAMTAMPLDIHDAFEFLSESDNDDLHVSISDSNIFFKNSKMVLYSSIITDLPANSDILKRFIKPKGATLSVYPSSIAVAARRMGISKTTSVETSDPVQISYEEGWFIMEREYENGHKDKEKVDADIVDTGSKTSDNIFMDVKSINKVVRKISSGKVIITLPDGVDTNYMYLQPEIDNDVSFLILGIQK